MTTETTDVPKIAHLGDPIPATVLKFPESKIKRRPEANSATFEKKVEVNKADYINHCVDGTMQMICQILAQNGLIPSSGMTKTLVKDMLFTADALKSALYRHEGIDHPLQKFVDSTITDKGK